jgi:hypothetical protein
MKDPDKCFDFQQQLDEAIDTPESCTASKKWETIKDNIQKTTVEVYGFEKHNSLIFFYYYYY